MSDDLVKRLRMDIEPSEGDMEDAADLIEAQAARIAELEAALAIARREGMVKAAQIADAFEVVTHLHGPWSDVGHECASQAAGIVAAAIRAAAGEGKP